MAAMATIAIAFSTLAISSSFILAYLTNVIRRFLPSSIRESTAFNHIILIATQLKWAFDFLLSYCLFPNYNYVPKAPAAAAGNRYEWKRAAGADGAGECSVCLCNVEEGDEIGELRCGHVFHRFCLETWVGYRHVTCPLCRSSLAPVAGCGGEIIALDFFSCSSCRDRDRLWLR